MKWGKLLFRRKEIERDAEDARDRLVKAIADLMQGLDHKFCKPHPPERM